MNVPDATALTVVICDKVQAEPPRRYLFADSVLGVCAADLRSGAPKHTCGPALDCLHCEQPDVHTVSGSCEGRPVTLVLACRLASVKEVGALPAADAPVLLLHHKGNLNQDGDEAYAMSEMPDAELSLLKRHAAGDFGMIQFTGGTTRTERGDFGFNPLLERFPEIVQALLAKGDRTVDEVLLELEKSWSKPPGLDRILHALAPLDVLVQGFLALASEDEEWRAVREAAPGPAEGAQDALRSPADWFAGAAGGLQGVFSGAADKDLETFVNACLPPFEPGKWLVRALHSEHGRDGAAAWLRRREAGESAAEPGALRLLVELVRGSDADFLHRAGWADGFAARHGDDEIGRKILCDLLAQAHAEYGRAWKTVEACV